MKRTVFFACALCLAAGLLAGGLLPMPWDKPLIPDVPALMNSLPPVSSSSTSVGTQTDSTESTFSSNDNFPLLNAACIVVRALRQQDYSTLAAFVHPQLGVTFTPYSTVDPESDLSFTQEQIMNLEQDNSSYTWGVVDGRGSPIEMTMEEYFARYVFNTDYSQAPQIGVDQILMRGNALENLEEAYPEARFVDFCFPQLDEGNDGMDWCSLKLVFQPVDSTWMLVGIVHGEWTI